MKKVLLIPSSIFALAQIFLLSSCKNEPKEENEQKTVVIAALNLEISEENQKAINYLNSISLEDTVAYYTPKMMDAPGLADYYRNQEKYFWNFLMRVEKEKFNNIDRLVKEISFNDKHKAEDLEYAQKLANKIKGFVVLRDELQETQKDSLFDLHLNEIYKIGDNTEGMEKFTLYQELKNEINQSTNFLASLRIAHAKSIDQLNRNIDSLKIQLAPLGIDTNKASNYY